MSAPAPVGPESPEPPLAARTVTSTSLRLYTPPDDYFTPGAYASSSATRRLLAPDLSFRSVRPSAPQPSAPAPVSAANALPAPEIATLDPLLFTGCIFDRERGPGVLGKPEWLLWGAQLRDQVLQNWSKGSAPLDPHDLYQRALNLSSDPAIALLLCFAATRAFARGGQAIRWEVQDRSRGTYTDGEHLFTAAVTHPAGVLSSGPLHPPSIFYLLFTAPEFGVDDPGDWYRFFAAAAAVSFAAGKRMLSAGPPPDAAMHLPGAILASASDADPVRFGWKWANALALAEPVIWARPKKREPSEAYRRGALFGAQEAGLQASAWDWQMVAPPDSPWPSLSKPPTLSANTVSAILATRSPHIRISGEHAIFQILCNVEEGFGCRFSSARWNEPLPLELALSIVDGIGWKFAEHAARRQILLRCDASLPSGAPASWQFDRGDGFQTI